MMKLIAITLALAVAANAQCIQPNWADALGSDSYAYTPVGAAVEYAEGAPNTGTVTQANGDDYALIFGYSSSLDGNPLSGDDITLNNYEVHEFDFGTQCLDMSGDGFTVSDIDQDHDDDGRTAGTTTVMDQYHDGIAVVFKKADGSFVVPTGTTPATLSTLVDTAPNPLPEGDVSTPQAWGLKSGTITFGTDANPKGFPASIPFYQNALPFADFDQDAATSAYGYSVAEMRNAVSFTSDETDIVGVCLIYFSTWDTDMPNEGNLDAARRMAVTIAQQDVTVACSADASCANPVAATCAAGETECTCECQIAECTNSDGCVSFETVDCDPSETECACPCNPIQCANPAGCASSVDAECADPTVQCECECDVAMCTNSDNCVSFEMGECDPSETECACPCNPIQCENSAGCASPVDAECADPTVQCECECNIAQCTDECVGTASIPSDCAADQASCVCECEEPVDPECVTVELECGATEGSGTTAGTDKKCVCIEFAEEEDDEMQGGEF